MISAFLTPLANRIMLAIITALLALLAVQTIRIEGLKIWPVTVEGWKPKAAHLQNTLDQIEAAQTAATEKAKAEKLLREQQSREQAQRIDDDEKKIRSDAMASAERYIAAHRVRLPTIASAAGGAITPTEDYSTQSSNGANPAPLMDEVAVATDDVRICTENTTRLEAARTWALGLNTHGQ